MARWQDLEDAEPGFAAELQKVFDAHKHKTIATLRADGAPRISGVEMQFESGELALGMMPGSLKARDLQRDPRLSIHSASEDADESDPMTWLGDAKISGRARELTDPDERAPFTGGDPNAGHHVFVIDIDSAVRIKIDGPPPRLLVQTWRPGRPIQDRFAD